MRTFTLYVQDSLFSVPLIDFIVVEDEERARKLAADSLLLSKTRTSVEVYEHNIFRFRIPPPDVAGVQVSD
jgi:hypothetical protein